MYAVVVAVKAPAGKAETWINSQSLADAFWAHAEKDDGLEHVRIACTAGRFSAVLFTCGEDETKAAASALALCWRLLMVVPFLAGWSIDSCAVPAAAR
ncbi:hypothetical protein [Kitasatospora brasiliensis]|uniref:hypothetical protein n=1 Tax=Kitasatospora brasiliensis TaxID=3058040 RepID=UPI0029303C0C|nr:hypothetical protein [Kitasatospora sp. K002]